MQTTWKPIGLDRVTVHLREDAGPSVIARLDRFPPPRWSRFLDEHDSDFRPDLVDGVEIHFDSRDGRHASRLIDELRRRVAHANARYAEAGGGLAS